MNLVLVRHGADRICVGFPFHCRSFSLPISNLKTNHNFSLVAIDNWKLAITPVPLPPAGCRGSTARTCAANPWSPPKPPWAIALALPHTDPRARRSLAKMARPVGANETSGLTACPAEFATGLYLLQLVLRS